MRNPDATRRAVICSCAREHNDPCPFHGAPWPVPIEEEVSMMIQALQQPEDPWLAFSRGHWTTTPPTAPGWCAVPSGVGGQWRAVYVKLHDGNLYCDRAPRFELVPLWWSVPVPALPEPTP